MARLEDLISTVEDAALREALAAEVRSLKQHVSFGLVFERHLPENVLLPAKSGLGVGEEVRLRGDAPDSPSLRVLARSNGAVRYVGPEDAEGEAPVEDLMVVKGMGDVIYPALRSVGGERRGGTKPSHAVISGENYHALQLLVHTCGGQVDCIFIDPPYNTGARDWKYNNDYVESTDTWRHSKWLSFMEKRLRLARRLLKPDGVLICTVDEHELHHLGVLIEQLFPGYLRYAVSVVINSRGSTGTRNFGVIEEQALYVVPDLGYDLVEPREAHVPYLAGRADKRSEDLLRLITKALPDLDAQLDGALDDDQASLLQTFRRGDSSSPADNGDGEVDDDADEGRTNSDEGSDVYWRGAVRTGQGTSFRTQRPKQFYALYLDEETKEIVEVGEPLLDKDDEGELVPPSWEERNGHVPIWPVDEEGRDRVWCYEPGRMRREIAADNIKVGRFNPRRQTYAVNVRRVRRTKQRFREITVWWEQAYDSGSNGTNLLKRLLGRSEAFPFPKSVYEVRDLLATVVGSKKDALIVDFFAGSGTTFHAACLLNAHDGGQRRTIMVTNNEVDADLTRRLNAEGHFAGDPEFERHGIFEAVTMPRAKAVITGRQPDGKPVPGKYKWAGGRPLADGFEENCEFFRLEYLDPDQVELGRAFQAIHPLLWLAAGARGERDENLNPSLPYAVLAESGYAVLFSELALREFVAAISQTENSIRHVFLVTDSEDAYAEMCESIGPGITSHMLYRDYLRSFRIHVSRPE